MAPDAHVDPRRVLGPCPGVPPHVRVFCVLMLALFLWLKGDGHAAMAWAMLGVGVVAPLAYALLIGCWLYRRRRVLRACEDDDVIERYELARRGGRGAPAARARPRPVGPRRDVVRGLRGLAGARRPGRGGDLRRHAGDLRADRDGGRRPLVAAAGAAAEVDDGLRGSCRWFRQTMDHALGAVGPARSSSRHVGSIRIGSSSRGAWSGPRARSFHDVASPLNRAAT
jgi:hypothetical protein